MGREKMDFIKPIPDEQKTEGKELCLREQAQNNKIPDD